MAPIPQLDPSALKFIQDSLNTTDLTVEPLAGDASSRRYFRVVSGDDSFVVMVWEPFVDDGNYPFLSIHAHFLKHQIQVPKVIAKNPRLGIVLLEDLGDLTLERKFWENQNQGSILPFYKLAIDELIKIHYLATADRTDSCVAFKVSFNVEKLLWELNYGREHLLEKLCGIKIEGRTADQLLAAFTDICGVLDGQPKHLCHRDYHSRNIMLKLGRARIIDFQDARLGPVQYDLVSLLHDSYVNLHEHSRQQILDYYLASAKPFRDKPISRDEFFEIFRIQMLQRCFKACGSFASFYNMREDQRYLRYIQPTLKKVADILDQYPRYSTFLKIIRDNGLLEKDFTKPVELS